LQQFATLSEHQASITNLDHSNLTPRCLDAHRRSQKRILGLGGERSESVAPFGSELVYGSAIFRLRQPAIAGNTSSRIRNVRSRQEGSGELVGRAIPSSLLSGEEINAQSRRGSQAPGSSGESFHGLPEQLAVEIETHGDDVSALSGSEQVSCPANLEITHRDFKS
jgi:hypothetical protein